jgi:hypothetical protein
MQNITPAASKFHSEDPWIEDRNKKSSDFLLGIFRLALQTSILKVSHNPQLSSTIIFPTNVA